MKKAGLCLIAVTLLFCAVIVGFLLGSYRSGEIQLSGYLVQATAATDTATEIQLPSITASGVKDGKVNINTASAQELTALPGIGSVLAQRIVDYRSQNGLFRSIDELSNVSGIGEKRLESIRQYIIL